MPTRRRRVVGRGIDRFASKAQWDWAFRTGQEFAGRWAGRSAQRKNLPKRAKGKR